MFKKTSTSILAVSGIIIAAAIICSTLFTGVAGAQFFPAPFGSDGFGYGYGQYGYQGLNSYYGMPIGLPGIGEPLSPFGMPVLGGSSLPYGMPSIGGQQMPYGMPTIEGPQLQTPVSVPSYAVQQPQVQAPVSVPSYAVQQPQVQAPVSVPSYAAQQPQAPISQPVVSGGTANMFTIPGLEGLQGFGSGDNKLSLAVIPVTQQNGQMGFQVIGFAITSSGNDQAAVYSLSTPLPCVIDPTQNTLQVDLANLANNIDQAGYVASDQVYSTIRSSAKVMVIDVDMAYQGNQGTQTTFSVNTVDIITPDGKMQAFSLQQPTQLVIDSQSMRIYMVAFPEMVSACNGFYGASYSDVLPIIYAQPIPILAPIFVPYLQPFPIFFSTFVGFNPLFFGSGFVSFYNRASFHGNFPIHDRDFGARAFSQISRGHGINAAGIGQGIAQGNRFAPSNIASARAPGVAARSATTPQANIASARAPGLSTTSGGGPLTGFANDRAPGVSIGSNSGAPTFSGASRGIGSGIGTGTSLGTGMGTGMGRGIGSGIGSGMSGIGSGMRIGGGRR